MLTSTPDTQSATALGATWDTKLIETVGLKTPGSRIQAESIVSTSRTHLQHSTSKCIAICKYLGLFHCN